MRPGNENGGAPDHLIDLRDAGFMSTGRIAEFLNVKLSPSYITGELGIAPHVITKSNNFYWSPEQVEEIREKLIEKLTRERRNSAAGDSK